MKSAIEPIKKLIGLTPHERHLLVYAWALLLLVDPALRVLPAPRLLPRGSVPAAPGQRLAVDRIGWLVKVAGRYAPGRMTCLKEALVLAWTLRQEGIEATVRIGVARRGGELKAHAWVEQGGGVIFGSAGDETYAPLLPTAPATRSS